MDFQSADILDRKAGSKGGIEGSAIPIPLVLRAATSKRFHSNHRRAVGVRYFVSDTPSGRVRRMDFFDTIIVLLVFLFAGGVKGIAGLGLPTVSLALLSARFGIEQAIPLLVIPSLLTNLWQASIGGRARALFIRFWPALILIPPALWIGYRHIFLEAPQSMERVLGGVLIVYAGLGLFSVRWSFPAGMEGLATPVVGFLNGLITGFTGTFVIPLVMYLEALGVERDELVQMMGIAFSLSTLSLAAVLVAHDAYRPQAGFLSAVAVIPAVAGMVIGAAIRSRMSPGLFRKWLMAGLAGVGIKLLVF
ncbi:MAG: sulfite exporter TauE/SafE family protein [Ectothiorhodospiraceae bacterium AqS1]|nr:sulfite exporter TauE/SafE family protein [Ectothiorhodospiraceae bacterium AqS1]